MAYCLGTNRELWFRMNDNLWNPNLKKRFLVEHSQLFTNRHYGQKRTEREVYEEA